MSAAILRRGVPVLVVLVLGASLAGCGIRSGHGAAPVEPATPSSAPTVSADASDPLAGIDDDLSAVSGATQQASQDLDAGNEAAGKSDNG